jgi:glutaredoxin
MKKTLLILITSLLVLTSCGADRPPTDIINPTAEYRYFFGATCPHCQELNRIAESKDLYSKISIEKREVYSNKENQAMFLALIEELDVEGSGVPFVYDTVTGKVAVGVRPVLELMTSRLGNKVVVQEEEITLDADIDETTTWLQE